jgi:hypothetical protein
MMPESIHPLVLPPIQKDQQRQHKVLLAISGLPQQWSKNKSNRTTGNSQWATGNKPTRDWEKPTKKLGTCTANGKWGTANGKLGTTKFELGTTNTWGQQELWRPNPSAFIRGYQIEVIPDTLTAQRQSDIMPDCRRPELLYSAQPNQIVR